MRCTWRSVCMSTLAVGSSIMTTRVLCSSVWAKVRSCLWPSERPAPGPPATVSSATAGKRPAVRSAARRRSSSWAPKGSRLYRTVPFMTIGSCGIIEIAFRSAWSPRPAMSTSSMVTRPASHSTRRNRTHVIVLLPAPVRPTMPIFSPLPMEMLKFLSARGRPSRYLRETPLKHTAPLDGQAVEGGSPGISQADSCGRSPSLNSTSRSRDAPFVSRFIVAPMVTIANSPNREA
mmetsp:Transcript_87853/g.261959  ORF Transcript_87853/g.261959 Transcript_87853/m.261959 type:complete len:233 (-) Transcript_87853:1269-1967(-)